ncbi:MAG: 7-cyano-7-deazaguanine synthase, partial [Nitrososphaeraceae archaeon]|nr:7-cyano-7-deazaguanine synthase [Nitrososphaeraceae archaeon]
MASSPPKKNQVKKDIDDDNNHSDYNNNNKKKKHTPKAVALLSGGLDSNLAVRMMQEQGVEVEAIAVKT